MKKLLLILTLCVLAVSAMAQGFRGMRGMMNSPSMLVNRDDVKTELVLTDDQTAKLAEIRTNTQSKMKELFTSGDREAAMKAMPDIMKDANEQVLKVLTADQAKRLKEIQYQLGGFSTISSDKDLQTSLAITDDQKSKIDAIQKQADEANQSVGEKMRNQEIEREEGMAAMKKNNDALNSGIEAILTADQKAKFKTMQGKTFVSTSQPSFGGRG